MANTPTDPTESFAGLDQVKGRRPYLRANTTQSTGIDQTHAGNILSMVSPP